MAAAVRTGKLMLVNIRFHLLVGPAGRILAGLLLNELVRTVTGFAVLAVHQRVGKAADMAGSNPGGRVHQDRRVQADVIRTLLHKLLAPRGLDVVLELHAERAVVPGVGQAAVDLRAGVYEAATLTQGNDLFHGFFAVVHFTFSFWRIWLMHAFFASR